MHAGKLGGAVILLVAALWLLSTVGKGSQNPIPIATQAGVPAFDVQATQGAAAATWTALAQPSNSTGVIAPKSQPTGWMQFGVVALSVLVILFIIALILKGLGIL